MSSKSRTLSGKAMYTLFIGGLPQLRLVRLKYIVQFCGIV
jgi:hypothetical protein